MEQASNKLCSENFRFDQNDSNLSKGIKKTLSMPCYNSFAKVSEVHENIGSYLTKERANYYLLQGRKFSRKEDNLNLWVNYKNHNPQYETVVEEVG